MAELLFIATTIFVAYVLFEALGKKTDTSEPEQPAANPVTEPKTVSVTEKTNTPPPAAAKPTSKTSTPKPTKPKPKAKKAPADKPNASAPATTLKNPKTGEVAKLPSNYAFAKRWIKEALVEEGLLDKIYKNNELDPAATAKIKDALEQLMAMEKYQ